MIWYSISMFFLDYFDILLIRSDLLLLHLDPFLIINYKLQFGGTMQPWNYVTMVSLGKPIQFEHQFFFVNKRNYLKGQTKS